MCHGSGVACLVFSWMPTFPENQLERYDIRSKQTSEAANWKVSDRKLPTGCHFYVFVVQVTSQVYHTFMQILKIFIQISYITF